MNRITLLAAAAAALRAACLVAALAHLPLHAAGALEKAVAAAALRTQKQCQMQLHHDADEYVDCVDALLKAHAATDATRLGIEYFGWVGALNSARISLPGANEAADRYLRQFRKTQRRLKVSNEVLCATVPGNCVDRIARMKQMEAVPALKSDRFDDSRRAERGHTR
jgi:hypothetical protein